MNRRRVLANGTWLADAVRGWGAGYAVVTPDDLAPAEPAAGIAVVVTNGDRLDPGLGEPAGPCTRGLLLHGL